MTIAESKSQDLSYQELLDLDLLLLEAPGVKEVAVDTTRIRTDEVDAGTLIIVPGDAGVPPRSGSSLGTRIDWR